MENKAEIWKYACVYKCVESDQLNTVRLKNVTQTDRDIGRKRKRKRKRQRVMYKMGEMRAT